MRHSDSIANLTAALVAAQMELEPIAKDRTNPHFKNRYATLDAIVEGVRPVLAKHGLAVIQGAEALSAEGTMKALTVETMLVHSSGEWLSNSAVVPIAKNDPQGAGGALTYGRRYGLSALLSLATEEDDDANGASRPAAQRAPARQAAPAQPKPAPATGEPEKKRDTSGEAVLKGLLANEHIKLEERTKYEKWLADASRSSAEIVEACKKVDAVIAKRSQTKVAA